MFITIALRFISKEQGAAEAEVPEEVALLHQSLVRRKGQVVKREAEHNLAELNLSDSNCIKDWENFWGTIS